MSHKPTFTARPYGAYSDGYRTGLNDGERSANVRFVWLGIALGVILSGFAALGVVAWLAR